MRKQPRVLVVGGTGFIGKNLVEHFAANQSFEVFAPNRKQLPLTDAEACTNYLRNLLPDVVIHAAVNIESVEESLRIFFNISNNEKYYGRMIQIGSGAEYDRRTIPPLVCEEEFGRSVPTDSYGLAKYLIARDIESRAETSKLVNLRLFGVFGPYEDINRRFISNNIVRYLSGLNISVNRDVIFDYLYIKDLFVLIDSLIQGLTLKHTSYNFTSGCPTRLTELAKIIAETVGYKGVIVKKCEGMGPEYSGSALRLAKEFRGLKMTTLRQAVSEMHDFYRRSLSSREIESFRERHNEI